MNTTWKNLCRQVLGASSARKAAKPRRTRSLRMESLEERNLFAVTDMTALAQLSPTPAVPTMLYLNFDGWKSVPSADTTGSGQTISAFPGTESQIQDIIFQVSEIFSPFNVEVARVTGNGQFSLSGGNTTIFIGGDSADTNKLPSGLSTKFTAGFTPIQFMDYPGSARGTSHTINSDPFDIAFVDPMVNAGGSPNWTIGQTDAQIAEGIAHEAGHTFGLAHVRTDGLKDPAPLTTTGTVNDIMSYDSTNQYFVDKTLPVTDFNYNASAGTTSIQSSLQPEWGTSNIVTQNSYTYLLATLGARSDNGLHIVHNGSVDNTVDTHLDTSHNYTVGTTVSGTLTEQYGDYNVYNAVTPTINVLEHYHVDIAQPKAILQGNPELLVYDSSGNLVTTIDSTFNPATNGNEIHANLLLAQNQTYNFVVGSIGGDGGFPYTFEISAVHNVPTQGLTTAINSMSVSTQLAPPVVSKANASVSTSTPVTTTSPVVSLVTTSLPTNTTAAVKPVVTAPVTVLKSTTPLPVVVDSLFAEAGLGIRTFWRLGKPGWRSLWRVPGTGGSETFGSRPACGAATWRFRYCHEKPRYNLSP